MDPESKKLLQDTFDLVKENNLMINKVRRTQNIATFSRIAYWVIIIGIAVGAFYFIQPFIDQIGEFTKSAGINFDQLKGLANMPR
ncbi:MAG: hypothetical protein WCX46_00805 [Candidatus Paceibacterota bacterium]